MCDITQDFSLQQLVPEPTRGTHLLLTNNPDSVTGMKVVDGLPEADHAAVDFVLKVVRPQSSAEKRTVYDFKKVNFEQFHDLLFPGTGVSIKDSWQKF